MLASYTVRHETSYRYAMPVALSRHLLHLTPRVASWQRLVTATLAIEPGPTTRRDTLDAFDNPVTRIAIEAPHRQLRVVSDCRVEIDARPWAGDDFAASTVAWESVRTGLDFGGGGPLEPTRFRHVSPYVRVKSELRDYALPSFPAGRPLFAAAQDLMARIHRDFAFDPNATEVGTSVLELLATRRGVCQDFAHFMIGALRSLGLAARYVSGYLLTDPPPGEERLAGADASHAWVALYVPTRVADEWAGEWIEFDPTNDCLADHRHIVVAWGRDFGDVSPLRGVIHGSGGHDLAVSVTVTRDEVVATDDAATYLPVEIDVGSP